MNISGPYINSPNELTKSQFRVSQTTITIGVDNGFRSGEAESMRYRTTKKNRYRLGLLVILATAIGTQLAPQTTLAATEPEWLTVLNLYRASAGIDAVTENPTASQGSLAHSQYLLQNRVMGHGEEPDLPGYSAEGVRGGETGNVASGLGAKIGQRATIEMWMTAPFHGLAMMAPNSKTYGYALTTSGTRWASTLSYGWDSYKVPGDESTDPLKLAVDAVERAHPDLSNTSMNASLRGSTIVVNFSGRRFVVSGESVRELQPGEAPYPTVVWPSNKTAVPLVRYAGSEWPDPITACKGWSSNAGLPILIRRSVPTKVVTATVTDTNGAPLQVCAIDSSTYRNPNPDDQEYAAEILKTNAIVIPKNPLLPGRSYRVRVELADSDLSIETLDWVFSTTTDGSIKLPPGSPMEGRATPGAPFQPVRAQATTPSAAKTVKPPVKPVAKKTKK